MPRTLATYLHEFTWITIETSYKQHVKNCSCSKNKLWIKPKNHSESKSNKKRVRTRKVKYEVFSEAEMSKSIVTFLLETSAVSLEVSRKVLCFNKKIWINATDRPF